MSKYYVAEAAELREKQKLVVRVNGMEVGLFHVHGNFYAWRNVCPHAGAPVCLGRVTGTTLPTPVYEYEYGKEQQVLRCPWHGWEFDLEDGKHLAQGSQVKLRGFEVLEEEGKLFLVMKA
jgi:nitrite reductase/ring-hydroxylating ferredoxin subunit